MKSIILRSLRLAFCAVAVLTAGVIVTGTTATTAYADVKVPPQQLVPSQPTATDYASYVRLSWPSVSGCNNGYAIYRSTSSTWSWNNLRVAVVSSASTYYYDYSVTSGTTYYYWVCPRDYTYTYANASRYVCIKHNGDLIPSQPTATDNSSYVRLSWPSVSGCNNGYSIYRSTSSTWSWNNQRIAVVTGTSYSDYSVASGTTYYYWVCPRDYTYTYANASKYVCIKHNGDLIPSKPVVSYTSSSFIYISWPKVTGAIDYAVYRRTYNSTSYNSTPPTFDWTGRIAVTSATSWYDYNTTPGVIYYYWIGPRDATYTYVNKSLWDWGWRKK